MDIKVTTENVVIAQESLNKGEYNIRECNFELAEEFAGLVCKALFTVRETNLTYQQDIVNNKCTIPYETTEQKGIVEVGVIGYEVNDEELIKRYSPAPDAFFVIDGSYVEDIENQSTPTPSELEQLEQRVSQVEIDAGQVETNAQDIADIKTKLDGLQKEITTTNKLSSDLVDDTNHTNKFVTATEKTQITTNKNNITSLNTNKEDKSNKVTSLSSSSTDTQYPSAKAVYNNLVNKADKSALVTGSGTEVTLQNTAELEFIQPPLPRGNSEQDGEPSSTNEVPITNVTGDVEVLVQNKNLFDKDTMVIKGYIGSQKNYIVNETTRCIKVPCKPNTSYTISKIVTDRLRVAYITEEPTNLMVVSGMLTNHTGSSITITTGDNAMYLLGYIWEQGSYNLQDVLDSIQVEQNTTATTYTPHKEQSFTFPLGTQRMYLGDYLADDGIHHVRKQVVFDGSSDEDWSHYSNSSAPFRIVLSDIKPSTSDSIIPNVKCTHFEVVKWNADFNNYNYLLSMHSNNNYLAFRNIDITSLADWKTWLSTHNVTVEYELATEEITPYTTEQQQAYDEIKQALSYEEQTNISGSSDESNPIFEVQAVQYKEPDYWTIAYVNTQIGNAIGGAY